MDAVEMSVLGSVAVSKILSSNKGFVREGVLVGGEAEIRESTTTVVPFCGSSGSVATGFNTARTSNKEWMDTPRLYRYASRMFHMNIAHQDFDLEKSRVVRQKHGLDGKRGDKRNFKAPMKTKFDSFFSKNGLTSSSSSSGGNNILGIYGLKSDIHAVTKHVDEPSLNELLDGSYTYSSVCQDKGKKAASTNENILHSVRKACVMLKSQKTVPTQNAVDLDGSSDKKTDTCSLNSGSGGTGRTDCDKGDNCIAEKKNSSCKESHSKPGAPARIDTSLLHEPKGILERLALQSAKDLDSLLLDTAKPAVSSRNNPDLGSGKPIPRRDSLPSFSWSHTFTGPCKTNMDMGKSTNRATCQGRWVRIGSSASYNGDSTTCYSDLDVFANDHDLLLSQQLKLGLSINGKTPFIPIRLPWYEQVSSSTMTCRLESLSSDKNIINGSTVMSSHYPLKPGLPHQSQDYFFNQLKHGFNMGIFVNNPKVEDSRNISMSILPDNVRFQENKDDCIEHEQRQRGNIACSTDSSSYSLFKCSVSGCNKLQWHLHESENSKQDDHSPRLLAAAQILHELASLSSIQNQSSVKIRWPKKPSQKSMKARKSRSPLRKPEVTPPIPPKPITGPNDHFMMPDRSAPSKKPRFFTNNQRTDSQSQTNNIGRGPMKWSSAPTSSRSSPSKLEKGLVTDTKKLSTDSLKYLGIMQQQPSSRVLDKTCSSNNTPQKLRKPLFIDWGRGRSKKE